MPVSPFEYAGYFTAVVRLSTGHAVPNVPVTIKDSLAANAVLWVDKLRAVTTVNPTVSDATGRIKFYAEPGTYTVTTAGGTPVTVVVEPYPDETEQDFDAHVANHPGPTAIPIVITSGGTGAVTAAGARTNLDVPSNAEMGSADTAAINAAEAFATAADIVILASAATDTDTDVAEALATAQTYADAGDALALHKATAETVTGVKTFNADAYFKSGDPWIDVKAYGAIGDGATHPLSAFYGSLAAAQAVYPHATALTNELDWAAIQGAANAAGTLGGGTVRVPAGTFKINQTISIQSRFVAIEGQGTSAAATTTKLSYSPTTGPCIQYGTFGDGNIADYSGKQNQRLKGLWIEGTYVASAASRTGTPYGIVDYEGGQITFDGVRISQFFTGFWGIASDLNLWQDVVVTYCEYGIDLRSRSDQNTFINLYGFGNYTMVRLDNVTNTTFIRPVFVDNIGTDLVLARSATDSDPFGAGAFTGTSTGGVTATSITAPWFEVYRDKSGGYPTGGEWPRGQPTKTSFVDVGVGDNSSGFFTHKGLSLRDVTVACEADDTSVSGPVATCLIRQGYGDDVSVDGISFYQLKHGWPIIQTTQVGTTINQGAVTYRGAVRVTGVRRGQIYGGAYTAPDIQGDVISPQNNRPPGALRQSIISNPNFRGDPVGWTIGATATVTAYTLVGSETSLGGNPLRVSPNAQYAGIKSPANLRLRANSAYEIVVRYRTSYSAGGFWAVKICPSATGTPPDSAWQRLLTPSLQFKEYRFTIETSGTSVTSPQLQVSYQGTTVGEAIILDYVDVQEIVPFDRKGQISRVMWGSAIPTAGSWDVGDTIISLAPGVYGWLCTTAGTPGTWTAFADPTVASLDTVQTLWLSPLADPTTVAQGIAFGLSKDVNLYRTGAGVLKLEGASGGSASLFMGGSFAVGASLFSRSARQAFAYNTAPTGSSSVASPGLVIVSGASDIKTTAQTGNVQGLSVEQLTVTSTPAATIIPDLSGLYVKGPTSSGNATATRNQAVLLEPGTASTVALVCRGLSFQAGDLQRWTDNSNGVLTRIGKAGHLITGVATPPADADLNNSELAISVGGNGSAQFKVKDSSGNVKLIAVGRYKSGAGVTTIADADFSTTPSDGTIATVFDSTTSKTLLCVRSNGAWTYVEAT